MKASMSGVLRLDGFPLDFLMELNEHLSVQNPQYRNAVAFSGVNPRYISVPERVYAGDVQRTAERSVGVFPRSCTIPDKLLTPRIRAVNIVDDRVRVPVDFPRARVTLNPMQQLAHRAFERTLDDEAAPGYLFVAGTAFGKTICMLDLAKLTQQRTLVITHRKIILHAWLEDARKFYGGACNAGIAQGNPSRWDRERPLVVGVAQSLRLHLSEAEEYLTQFGTVILDEAHICPCNFIVELMERCPAMYRFGCTATPKRADHMEALLYWHFGTPWRQTQDTSGVSRNHCPITRVNLVPTRFEYRPEGGESEDGVLNVNEVEEQVAQSASRNAQIVHKVLRDYEQGHSVLVATARIAHVDFLEALLRPHVPSLIRMTGGTSPTRIKQAVDALQSRKSRLLLSTRQFICEGANIPVLDRLHITVPISARGVTRQLCGRISRACPGKKDAQITLYHDVRVPCLRKRVSSMVAEFRKLKIRNMEDIWLA